MIGFSSALFPAIPERCVWQADRLSLRSAGPWWLLLFFYELEITWNAAEP
jgi:hypothetical protein